MNALTAKQEHFALAYVQSGSSAEAYRTAYSSNGKPATVWRRATELMQTPHVLARIQQLQDEAAQAVKLTLEQHLTDLKELRDKAAGDGRWSAAVAAEVARGKAAGLYVERIESKVTAQLLPASIEEFV